MELAPYVHDIQSQLTLAAEAGGDDARVIAERLLAPLESAIRLALLDALSTAAGEITRELAPASVDLRLRGRDPEFVVSASPQADYVEVSSPRDTTVTPTASVGDADDDVSTSRTTLRLPDQLKARVDDAAAADGLSVNAWLVRAIAGALEPKNRRTAQRESRSADQYTGWAR